MAGNNLRKLISSRFGHLLSHNVDGKFQHILGSDWSLKLLSDLVTGQHFIRLWEHKRLATDLLNFFTDHFIRGNFFVYGFLETEEKLLDFVAAMKLVC